LIFSRSERQLVELMLARAPSAASSVRSVDVATMKFLDLYDRVLGLHDPEVGDRVSRGTGDVVLGDHFLRRDVQCDRAGGRRGPMRSTMGISQNQPGGLSGCGNSRPKPEDDRALVLAQTP